MQERMTRGWGEATFPDGEPRIFSRSAEATQQRSRRLLLAGPMQKKKPRKTRKARKGKDLRENLHPNWNAPFGRPRIQARGVRRASRAKPFVLFVSFVD